MREITNLIDKHSDFLEENYKVENIGIFGSVTKGQETKSSDIDILVDLSEPVGLFKFIELENFLGRILGRKVDLVTRRALKPMIKKEVLKEVVYV